MNDSFVINTLKKYYTDKEIDLIISGFSLKRKTTFRINYIKSNEKEIDEYLKSNNIKYNKFDKIKGAYILTDNINVNDLSIYNEGKIYVQSLSSMLPVLYLDVKENDNILDMCSAPGGKTTQIQSICNNKANVTAIELNKIRYNKLLFNIDLQSANVLTMNIDANNLDDNLKFDKILLDAPCSGSGVLDLTNNNYEKYFTQELIDKSVKRQKLLIRKALKLLKKGGTLVYSTCSILNVENEEQVKSLPKGEIIKVLPDELYEGFFIYKGIIN